MRACLILLLTTLLAACGFQLRGNYSLPFETLHLALPESAELHAQIRRNIESGSAARVVASAREAEASLSVLRDQTQKQILALDSSGRVREYQLVRQFGFRLTDAKGRNLIPPAEIVVRRDVTYSDALVLSKEAEEALLLRDMQNDLVQQLMRRLAVAKPRT